MNILFVTSAHNGLSQRLWVELTERGHEVIVLRVAVEKDVLVLRTLAGWPDLVVAPMLKIALPEELWRRYVCLVVHPGVVGDRGASSLDWAILEGREEWGVTVLQAEAEFDAGPIWASRTFPVRPDATKSSLYRVEVTDLAAEAVLEAIERFQAGDRPIPVDYADRRIVGRARPNMRQADRAIDWSTDSTETVLRKIRASDSQPGVFDPTLNCFLFGGHEAERLEGPPGQLVAQRDGAVARATVDGAVWITHMEARERGRVTGIKLPATQLVDAWGLPVAHREWREIRYTEHQRVGLLSFDFNGGAMSTDQCNRLREAYVRARDRSTRVIVLLGGREFFSNGIHLGVIEGSDDPIEESWRNIEAIDDLVLEILTTTSHLVVAGMRGNAGAGGVMFALAADRVYAREGVVLNPHYRTMGGLYGSEYWTYTLPRRVGRAYAEELTEQCDPIGTRKAKGIGLIDDAFGQTPEEFERILTERVVALSEGPEFAQLLDQKRVTRERDEQTQPLALFREHELRQMARSFHGVEPGYHEARSSFIRRTRPKPKRASKTGS